METIKAYLENLFLTLPKTENVRKVRDNLLEMMEDKYHELKAEGKSENEAVGIVIAEFGNIDELQEELNLPGEIKEEIPVVTEEEVNGFLAAKKTFGNLVGIGVFLCIVSPIYLIYTALSTEAAGVVVEMPVFRGMVVLFLLVAGGVALFLIAGAKMNRYEYLEYDSFYLERSTKEKIRNEYEGTQKTFTAVLICGITLCILSPLLLILESIQKNDVILYSLPLMLFLIAIAVFFFVRFCTIRGGYQILLEIGDYSSAHKKSQKSHNIVEAILWPLATLIYLIAGFGFDLWGKAWFVFVIAAILSWLFSEVLAALYRNK